MNFLYFNKVLSVSFLALSMVFLSGCGEREFTFQNPDAYQSASGDNSGHPHDEGQNCQDDQCYTDTYVQEGSAVTQSLDLLIVTDTSGSLNNERARVADNIDKFVAMIPSEVDINIGVILAHGNTSRYHGQLYQRDAEPLVLKSSDPSLSMTDIREMLMAKLTQNLPTDGATDGGEAGIASLLSAINFVNLPGLQSEGMLREDASLAVIFISDENDICTPGEVPDPDNKEESAFFANCEGVLPIGAYNRLKFIKGDKPLILSAIVYTDESTVPTGGEDEIGLGYLAAVEAAGEFGLAVDLASENIVEALEQIGELSGATIEIRKEFELLQSSSVNANSIIVRVDGEKVEHSYDSVSNTVQLEYAGQAGSEIVIGYCDNDGDGDSSNDCDCNLYRVPMCHFAQYGDRKEAYTVYVDFYEVLPRLHAGDLIGKCESHEWIKRWKKNYRRH